MTEFCIRNRTCIHLVFVLLALSALIVPGNTAASKLWEENDDGSSLAILQSNATNQELGAISPAQLVAFEADKRSVMFNETLNLAKTMKTCQVMVAAAHKLSSFVPHARTKNQTKFWEGTMTKIMANTLHQDVLARSLISKCFGRIRDLGLVIQNVYKIVRRSRGSKKGIAVAKMYVPAALDKITDCIRSVEALDSNIIRTYGQNTNTFIKMIGSEAANFTNQIVECDVQIQKARDEQQDLVTQLGVKKGELERNHYLMTMTQRFVGQSSGDLQETRRRVTELARLNSEVEQAIRYIRQTVTKTVTTSGKSCNLWVFCRPWIISRPVQVPNPDRWSQERLYRNVIRAREARLSKLATDVTAKQTVVEQFVKEYADYKLDYNRSKSDLEQFQETFRGKFNAFEGIVVNALDRKREINDRAREIYDIVGLEGGILIETLGHVESFSQTMNPAATAYSPFAAILNTIKSLVEAHVGLLSSDEPSDIFLAGALLVEQAKFLSDYVVGAQQILNSDVDNGPNGPAIAGEPQQKLLT